MANQVPKALAYQCKTKVIAAERKSRDEVCVVTLNPRAEGDGRWRMTAKQASHTHTLADYSQQGRAYRFSVKQPRMCSHSSSGRGGSGSEAAAWPCGGARERQRKRVCAILAGAAAVQLRVVCC